MDFSRPDNARKINKLKVLSALRKTSLSRAELSSVLKINKVSIGEIAEILIAEGLIKEVSKTFTKVPGRPAIKLSIRPEAARVFSFEVKSKVISASVSDALGRIIRFERFPRNENFSDDVIRIVEKMKGETKVYGAAVVGKEELDFSFLPFPFINISPAVAEARSEMSRRETPKKTLFLSWSDSFDASFLLDTLIPLPSLSDINVSPNVTESSLEESASGNVLKEKSGFSSIKEVLSSPLALSSSFKKVSLALKEASVILGAERIVITGEMSAMGGELFKELENTFSSLLPPFMRYIQLSTSLSGEKGTREGAAIIALDHFFYSTLLLESLASLENY